MAEVEQAGANIDEEASPIALDNLDVRMASSSSSSGTSSASSSSSSSSGDDDGGAADGEDGTAPPPPGPGGRDNAAAMGNRNQADKEVVVAGGFIRYYNTAKKKFCVAHCESHAGRCVLTRTVTESSAAGRQGQGRPLGLMLAWLAQAGQYASPGEHVHAPSANFSYQDRLRLREDAAEIPGMQYLFDFAERPVREGESAEPEHIP